MKPTIRLLGRLGLPQRVWRIPVPAGHVQLLRNRHYNVADSCPGAGETLADETGLLSRSI